MGGGNPVSSTIMAIILMWPTFPAAYHFSMKTVSHISISSPRAFLAGKGRPIAYMCAETVKSVYVPTSA